MKIRDLIREFNPDQVSIGTDINKDWNKGADAVKSLVDPKKWFGGGSDTAKQKQLSGVEVRDALVAAANNKLSYKNVSELKQILANLQAGEFKAANSQSIVSSLKTAIAGGTLTSQQSLDLQAFAKTF